MISHPSNLDKYKKGLDNWTEELNKYPTDELWPYDTPRIYIIGLCRIWRGYLEQAGILERKIINPTTTNPIP